MKWHTPLPLAVVCTASKAASTWVTHPMDQPLEWTTLVELARWYPDLGTTSTSKSTPIDEPLLTLNAAVLQCVQ
jgi:hypothetical protein